MLSSVVAYYVSRFPIRWNDNVPTCCLSSFDRGKKILRIHPPSLLSMKPVGKRCCFVPFHMDFFLFSCFLYSPLFVPSVDYSIPPKRIAFFLDNRHIWSWIILNNSCCNSSPLWKRIFLIVEYYCLIESFHIRRRILFVDNYWLDNSVILTAIFTRDEELDLGYC